MRASFPIAFLNILFVGACFSQDVVSTRTIPPDFPEITFPTAFEYDHFVVKVLNPCSITGSTVGGLWIGRQVSNNEWDASMVVPKLYARTHKGVFSGSYTKCGGSGSTPPPPLTWKGGASAGHYYVGPMIVDLKYIHEFDYDPAASIINDAYITKYDREDDHVTSATLATLDILILGLQQSTNPEPSTVFNNEADWLSTLVSTKKYRLINKVAIQTFVTKNNTIDINTSIGTDMSAGFTPFAGLFWESTYGVTTQDKIVTDDFVQITQHVSARLSDKFALPPMAIGLSVPYIWSNIVYRVNSDGTYSVAITDGHFPQTNIYKSDTTKLGAPFHWVLTKILPQENLAGFMVTDANLVEAPAHSASPTMYEGMCEAQ